jgi:hypothetical protein
MRNAIKFSGNWHLQNFNLPLGATPSSYRRVEDRNIKPCPHGPTLLYDDQIINP